MIIHPTFEPAEAALQNALEIAFGYLVQTGQAEPTVATQYEIARTLVHEWNTGKRHRIWLANKAIVAFQKSAKQKL